MPDSYLLDTIRVRGARMHNLRAVDVDLPRYSLVVVTGLSGSGKSSLAFDTIYAEGQRRYVESLSAYARQFLEQMERPDVESIEGLSPAIAIEQKTTSKNPRSTVGTVTELYDFLRLLYARVGTAHCPRCDRPVRSQTTKQIVDSIMGLDEGSRLQILAPIVRGRKGEFKAELQKMARSGFVKARIDGKVVDIDPPVSLRRHQNHDIEIVVDRVILRKKGRKRIHAAVSKALGLAGGVVIVNVLGEGDYFHSRSLACPHCEISVPELAPRSFSFNSPRGACPACEGLGRVWDFAPDLVVPEPDRSLSGGAIRPWRGSSYPERFFEGLCEAWDLDPETPWQELPESFQEIVLYGPGEDDDEDEIALDMEGGEPIDRRLARGFAGVIPILEDRYEQASAGRARRLQKYMREDACRRCKGQRLRPESLAVRIGGLSIAELTALPVDQALEALDDLEVPERLEPVAEPLLKELRERLSFLLQVGLGYLTLDRPAGSLAGGESQRIRLATQIGTRLRGVLYVLDEPSIGLHQRDNRQLLDALRAIRDQGNTVIVVEHDEETIRAADWVVDLGPGAGEHGGRVVAEGPPDAIEVSPDSLTGAYLAGGRAIPMPVQRRTPAPPPEGGVPGAVGRFAEGGAWDGGAGRSAGELPGEDLDGERASRAGSDPADDPLAGIRMPGELSPDAGSGRVEADSGKGGAGKRERGRKKSKDIDDSGDLFPGSDKPGWLVVHGARHHNLKSLDAAFPLGCFVVVTGVSGSGKSSLVQEIVYPHLAALLHRSTAQAGPHDAIEGVELLDKVIDITQDPIGRTPRSNAATYVGAFTPIRQLFSSLPEAKVRGYEPGRFSFNVPGGRCPGCEGAGVEKIEMHFLPDVHATCDECNGRRYNDETLQILFRGHDIAEVLDMTVERALELFENVPPVARRLQTLHDVGLGYIRLGQPATTLSGGEAQRVKLAKELSRVATGNTLYILDEPTTGLHFEDVRRLLEVLNALVEQGNTVVVIEHNLEVVKCADWILDLGPEGGEEGGEVVVAGTPEQVARHDGSHTGRYLREILEVAPVAV